MFRLLPLPPPQRPPKPNRQEHGDKLNRLGLPVIPNTTSYSQSSMGWKFKIKASVGLASEVFLVCNSCLWRTLPLCPMHNILGVSSFYYKDNPITWIRDLQLIKLTLITYLKALSPNTGTLGLGLQQMKGVGQTEHMSIPVDPKYRMIMACNTKKTKFKQFIGN